MSDMATKETHNGAKNGGGYWGTRQIAKTNVKRSARRNAKADLKRYLR
jgi:hypothetical protein